MSITGSVAAPLEPAEFDDVARLLAADHEGALRGAASAGALVRAVAGAVAEGALARIADTTVRSVVLVAPQGPARRAAAVVQALVGEHASVPVLAVAHTPRWVGPLDVVVVAADDPGDIASAESVARAVGRGAEVVIAAPQEGLLTPAGAGRALLLPPRVAVPDGMGLLRFVAVDLAVLAALQVTVPVDLTALADELDADAERNQPSREVFGNPAKLLALRCASHRLVIAADTAAAEVVAGHLAASLLQHAGVVATAVQLPPVLAAQRHDARSASGPVPDPIFHDPQIDDPLTTAPLRVVLLGTPGQSDRLQARSVALSDVDLAVVDIESGVLAHDATAELLVLAARCETAAVYLGLAAWPA